MRASRSALLLGVVSLVLLSLVYGNSLHNGFHYDDFHSIVDNPHIRDPANCGSFFLDPEMFSALRERAMYRPLLLLTYALNYRVGGYAPAGYHLVNLGVHAACVLLLYLLGRALGMECAASGLGSLLFALHPVNGEVVNYISSRSESLAALGYLGALLAYVCWRRGGARGLYAASLVAFAGGLLAKSVALTLPAALLLYESVKGSRGEGVRRRVFFFHLPYWALAGGYVLVVWALLARALEEPVRGAGAQLWTQVKAWVYYLHLFAIPAHLSVEHPFAVAAGGWRLEVMLPLLLLVSGGWLAASSRRRTGALLLGWAALSLAPASLLPLNVLVNEHRLYLPAAFLSLSLAPWLVRLGGRRAGPAAAGVWLLLLALLAHQRNPVWKDELSLWSDAVARAPLMPRAHMHLGGALEERGILDRALQHYQRAAELGPSSVEAHYNLGNALRRSGRLPEAEAAYGKSLELKPGYAPALVNLAMLYLDEGRVDEAETLLLRGKEKNPLRAEIHHALGRVYRAQGRRREAEQAYLRAMSLRPEMAEAYYNLGNLYADMGAPGKAARRYEQALVLQSDHGHAYNNLALLYLKQHQYARAVEVCTRGLRRAPGQGSLYYVLARAQDELGRRSAALANYRLFIQRVQSAPAVREYVRSRIRALEERVE